MARVTVEDCITNIPNRFELVGLAARRAKQISGGNPITIDRDNDKDAVVSLREIAGKTVKFDPLREEIIEGYSRHQRPDVIDGVAPPPAFDPAERRAQLESASEELTEVEMSNESEEFEEEMEKIAEMPDGMAFADEDVDVED